MLMHAEGNKATPASKAADNNETEGCYTSILSGKAITCTQIEIKHLFKIEASSFFVNLKLVHHGLPHGLHTSGRGRGQVG
jgi:hypothetical protein